ncbi:MAG: hypothetical protein U9M89_02010 [Patescibacteria group bacterium]|nr:hypothetical protein [Patescibacteria group bacterium]
MDGAMRYILIVLLFCLTVQAYAGVELGSVQELYDLHDSRNNWLSLPRWKAASVGDTVWAFPCQHGPLYDQWLISTDSGGSYSQVQGEIDAGDYVSDHAGFWYAGGVHAGFPRSSFDYVTYRHIASPANNATDREALDDLTDADFNPRVAVCAYDQSHVWLVARWDNDSLTWWNTTDRFAADTSSGKVRDISRQSVDSLRIGMVLGGSNNPILVVLIYGSGYYYYTWNSTDFTAGNDSAIVEAAGLAATSRGFTINYLDGKLHLLYGHPYNTDSTILVHYVQDGVGGWDSTRVSRLTALNSYFGEGSGCAPITCAKNDTLVCFYNIGDRFVMKQWRAGSWGADSTAITPADDSAKYLQCPPNVTNNYIPVFWSDYKSGRMGYSRKLTFTPDSSDVVVKLGKCKLGKVKF